MKIVATSFAALWFATSTVAADESHKVLMRNARVKASLESLRKDDDRTLQEQISISQIPAPGTLESVRAKDFAARLVGAGLTEVTIDAAGNVIGKRKGTGRGPLLVLSAHLDTVFAEGTDVTVVKRDARYYGPGIADDARGLAALLSVLRAMQDAKLKTVGDVWFVATVGEEALGNLRGVKALFASTPNIDGFISVDDADSPAHIAEGRSYIVSQATGSRRWEITLSGPGGHSFENFGNPSAIHAQARAIARIADFKTSADPKTTFNVGVVAGGTGVTAIAATATMQIDLRSNSADALKALEDQVFAAVDEAVTAENARSGSNAIRLERKLIGDRPASTKTADLTLVNAAIGAHRALQLPTPGLRAASTDSNVPLGLGIPAVTMNGGGLADKAHSIDEWYEPLNAWVGPQTVLLTTLLLTGLEGVSKPTLAIRARKP